MSATTTVPTRRVPAVGATKVTAFSVLRAEWAKAWSLRSTYWVSLVCFLTTVGIGSLAALAINAMPADALDGAGAVASLVSLPSYFVAMFAASLGVLFITGEYSTGQIRSTLSAVPSRWPVFVAKALTAALFAALVSLVSNLALLPVGQLIVKMDSFNVFSTVGLKAVAFTALFHTFMAIMGAGLGFLLRHTAGAVTAVAVILFVLVLALQISGGMLARLWEPLGDLINYLPAMAGLEMISGTNVTTNLLTLSGWALVPLVIGAVLFMRRDA
ncbi:MAG: ABC transporter permease subunit [Buchananella hordeovulneris]|nr:ABC transporter permease subunit [Buchananella hordeovulneris]